MNISSASPSPEDRGGPGCRSEIASLASRRRCRTASRSVPLANGDCLGWQYQEGQWRLAVMTGHFQGRTKEAREQRHQYVAETYGRDRTWFDFGPLSRALGYPDLREEPRAN